MSDCLFCRIEQGQIPATVVRSDADTLAFEDIAPKAPVHVLVIPRRHLATLDDARDEDREMLGKLMLAAADVARVKRISDTGYRVLVNVGRMAGQTVFHVHLHVLGGRLMSDSLA